MGFFKIHRFMRLVPVLLVGIVLLTLPACQTLREVSALRDVQFRLDAARNVSLAGVSLDRVQRYEDLTVVDVLRLTNAATQRRMPLEFTLMVGASNPTMNPAARVIAFDWTLLLENRETISGRFNEEVYIPSGATRQIPLTISLDLVQFFGNNLQELADLGLAIAGEQGVTSRIALRATPTLQTPIGPVRYPEPIMIVNRQIGR